MVAIVESILGGGTFPIISLVGARAPGTCFLMLIFSLVDDVGVNKWTVFVEGYKQLRAHLRLLLCFYTCQHDQCSFLYIMCCFVPSVHHARAIKDATIINSHTPADAFRCNIHAQVRVRIGAEESGSIPWGLHVAERAEGRLA
jgi:hypothetical protein